MQVWQPPALLILERICQAAQLPMVFLFFFIFAEWERPITDRFRASPTKPDTPAALFQPFRADKGLSDALDTPLRLGGA